MEEFVPHLVKKENVAEGTMAFYFAKPEGFTYIPGQHASLLLENPVETDDEGNKRTFSFITIPSEDVVGFATRMRDSAFKRNLKNAEEGMQVKLINPRGSMVLPQNTTRTLVFLAGGIGITPFISMVKQATHDNSPQRIVLFHSNKTREEAQFFTMFEEFAQKNPNFTFVPVLTREELLPADWNGEKGHVNIDMIKKYIPDVQNSVYYLAGPAGLVQGMTETLTNAGVDTLFIKSEDFGEYK